ncbi:MAG: DUF3160 domain-containing protein [Kofleriaceae bacterium]
MRKVSIVAVLAVACGAAPNPFVPKDARKAAERQLNSAEQELVRKQGFAILGGSETTSFHLGYTALFEQHQPVYVTADSILYAWHSSYDQILQDVERAYLIPAVRTMIEELRTKLARSKADPVTSADLDIYLSIAQSLLDDKVTSPSAGGELALIDKAVKAVKAEQPGALMLFGESKSVDFSMFKPRGHYESYPEMQQYFRAMSWLGRAEIEIAYKRDGKSEWRVNRRALRGARLLAELYDGGPRSKWNLLDRTIGAFVGPQDSMSIDGLVVAMATLANSADAPDAQVIAAFKGATEQKIRSRLIKADGESLSFITMGQRFVADSKVFSDLVYGSLPVKRLMPSPLDVAHAVFKNPAAKPLLKSEIDRYGEPYLTALDAAAATKRDPKLWEATLYHGWLDALSKLSPDPKSDAALPAPLASVPWARRMMATQLASWAELRHDNLLYAKQSFTSEIECEYPDAYVEPYPAFYAAMARLAKHGKATLDALGTPRLETAADYFDTMAATMEKLGGIAERQRANEQLRSSDLDFINRMVSVNGRNGGCGGPTTEPAGWYADLFYDRGKILSHDVVIADVHTQPDDEAGNRVGRVLHVGTRAPRMFVVRLQHDGGKNAQTYRGYVSTYAETITKDFRRYTDSEWVTEAAPVNSTPAWLAPLVAR